MKNQTPKFMKTKLGGCASVSSRTWQLFYFASWFVRLIRSIANATVTPHQIHLLLFPFSTHHDVPTKPNSHLSYLCISGGVYSVQATPSASIGAPKNTSLWRFCKKNKAVPLCGPLSCTPPLKLQWLILILPMFSWNSVYNLSHALAITCESQSSVGLIRSGWVKARPRPRFYVHYFFFFFSLQSPK